MLRAKKTTSAANKPTLDPELSFSLENSDSDIALKIATITDPNRLFQLAETDADIYKYILNSSTLFEALCNNLNLETLVKMINNNELFILLSSKHLIKLCQLRPEIVKKILENYPWAFDFLSGDDFVSLSGKNVQVQTAQAILQSDKIRERLSKANLLTLYQRDKTKTLLLEIISYADLFKMINVETLPPEDATYVYKNIPILTLFNHAQKDKEIYQIILNNLPLLERVDALSEKMITDDLLLSLPPELLLKFGILYPGIGLKMIRFCVLPPFALLTGDHLAKLGKGNPMLAEAILGNQMARQRLNKANLLTLCEKNPSLLSKITGDKTLDKLAELVFAEGLSAESEVYRHLNGDTLFNLAEKYRPVLHDILSNLSLFKKMCHKTILRNAILYDNTLRERLFSDHLAILILLDPSIIKLIERHYHFFPTIEHFVSIGKNDPEMIPKILSNDILRKQLDKEKLFTLYQSVHDSLRGKALLAILTYSDLFQLINLSDLPSKDTQYVYDHIDLKALWSQVNENLETYLHILNHMPLFERLCRVPEIREAIKDNSALLAPLTTAHLAKLQVGLWANIKSTTWNFLRLDWLFGTKASAEKRKLEPIEAPSKKQSSESQTTQAAPSHLIAYNQKRSWVNNTVENEEIALSQQSNKRKKI